MLTGHILALLLAAWAPSPEPALTPTPALGKIGEPTPLRRERCGLVGGPVAPRPETALTIAKAVAETRQSAWERAKHDWAVVDSGGAWTVFQTPRTPPCTTDDNHLCISTGGGGLAMRIDKCDGRIDQIHYSR